MTLRNIIHSAIAMMVCFGSLAGMYLLLGAGIVCAVLGRCRTANGSQSRAVLLAMGSRRRPWRVE